MSDFSRARCPVARKEYKCEWCSQKILVGEKHFHFTGVWQSEWQNWRMHQECHEAECAENRYGDEGFEPFENDRPRIV